MRDRDLSRRRFVRQASAGLLAAGIATPGRGAADLLASLRIWDGHCHLAGFDGKTIGEKMAGMIRFADCMSIERMCVFLGYPIIGRPAPEEMRAQNDQVIEAVSAWPGRAFGYAFLNPKHPQASLDELNRTVRDGPLVGVKFEFDTVRHAGDTPGLDRLIERAGELRAVVMYHTWIKTTGNEPDESTPAQLAALAARHPSVAIFCGHTGGNWELGIRQIRTVRNLYAEVSGSDPAAGFVEMAVRELGAERVIYGSDAGGRSFASQLAKVIGAGIPDTARRLVLGENLRRALRPGLEARGIRV